MKSKMLLVMTTLLCASVLAASAAHSASESFSLSVDSTQGVFGGPGSTTVLDAHAVPASLVGRVCQVTADVHNNDSVREGTDFLVTSNGVTLTVSNVERSVGDTPPAIVGKLALGATLSVSLRFGPEGAASVGTTLLVDCPDTLPPPTTTLVVPGVVVSPALASPALASPALASPALASPASPSTVVQPSTAVVIAQPRFTG